MRLIGVTGLARSGKDHAAYYLAKNLNLYKYAFAEPLKTMLKSVFGDHFHEGDRSGICPETGRSYREMMQTLGTEWGRDLMDPQVWVNLVGKKWDWVKRGSPYSTEVGMVSDVKINDIHISPQGMILSDVRFDSEAAWIKEHGGILIEIDRSGTVADKMVKWAVGIPGHASESGVNRDMIDITIRNDGTLFDFDMKLLRLVSDLQEA